jgi:xylulokinase
MGQGDLLLGYDLGTTGVKAAVFTEKGELVASAYCQYLTYYPGPGRVIQRPSEWWAGLVQATRELAETRSFAPSRLAALSLSGQMLGQIPIDASGRLVLEEVPIWADSRATQIKDSFIAAFGGEERLYQITMQGMNLELYSLFKILWLREHAPEVFQRTWKFLHTKDYIGFRLTGSLATDYSDQATGCVLDVRRRDWASEVLQVAGLSSTLFPELHESSDQLGTLKSEIATELSLPAGLPVIVGSGDAPASAAGAMAVEPGDVYFYLGSAAWGGSIEDQPIGDFASKIIVMPHIVPNLYHSQVVMNTGAIAQQWAVENLYGENTAGGDPYLSAIREASAVPLSENTILFLPYLRPGGAPHNNLNARGVFFGIGLEHSRAHLFRAVLEGFAFSLRQVIERFEHFRGQRIERFTVIGGGARNPLWMQLIASITGRQVITTRLNQASNCFAAAVNAGIGIGLIPSYRSMDREGFYQDTWLPQVAESDFYERKYRFFLRAYDDAVPTLNLLASLRTGSD